MAHYDRFDICYAAQALENDFNSGGWLRERPSNLRRMEATHVQLARLKFRAAPGTGGSFDALVEGGEEYDNACDIYIEALIRFGLARLVAPDDAIAAYLKEKYVHDYAAEHFPQLYK